MKTNKVYKKEIDLESFNTLKRMRIVTPQNRASAKRETGSANFKAIKQPTFVVGRIYNITTKGQTEILEAKCFQDCPYGLRLLDTFLEIVELDTHLIIKRVDVSLKTERQIEKLKEGFLINLNKDKFFLRIKKE